MAWPAAGPSTRFVPRRSTDRECDRLRPLGGARVPTLVRSGSPNANRTACGGRVDRASVLRDHDATLYLQPSSGATRGLHQLAPVLPADRTRCLTRTDRCGRRSMTQQIEDRCFQLLVDRGHTSSTARIGAVANLGPRPSPFGTPLDPPTTRCTPLLVPPVMPQGRRRPATVAQGRTTTNASSGGAVPSTSCP